MSEWTWDSVVNVAYLKVQQGSEYSHSQVAEGSAGMVVVDYDKEGRLTGIEVLDATEHLSFPLFDRYRHNEPLPAPGDVGEPCSRPEPA